VEDRGKGGGGGRGGGRGGGGKGVVMRNSGEERAEGELEIEKSGERRGNEG